MNDDGLPLSGRQVQLRVSPEEKIAISPVVKTDKNGVTTIFLSSGKPGMKIINAYVDEIELTSVAV